MPSTATTADQATGTAAGAATGRKRLAVFKFASCDGCQLTLLDCEDELLALADTIEIAHFTEATRTSLPGPYDLALVEGSITTAEDAERIRQVRADSRFLVVLGACATAGGIQALRNFADVQEFTEAVYARPDYISTLEQSTAIADHVPVDFELRGCPIDRGQLLEVITAYLAGRKPRIPDRSVCFECKARGTVCVTVADGTPCLGPVTHAGCGAICPAFRRGCYGCFGPAREPNTGALIRLLHEQGESPERISRVFRTFNAASPAFLAASRSLDGLDVEENGEGHDASA